MVYLILNRTILRYISLKLNGEFKIVKIKNILKTK